MSTDPSQDATGDDDGERFTVTGDGEIDLVYGPDDESGSLRDTVLYTLQWVFIGFYPVVWGLAIVGLGIGLTDAQLGQYMSRVVLMIGVATLLQAYYGHRLSMITGPNIVSSFAVVAAFAIGGTEYALLSFNAFIIAGIIVFLLGVLGVISWIKKVWSPLVLGSMVMMVALASASVGLELLAEFGASWPFMVGIGLALLSGYISVRASGLVSTIPVLIVVALGYIIFIATGRFNWELVNQMPTLVLPQPFPYGIEMPPLDLIITMTVVHLLSAVNLYGNVEAYENIAGIELTQPERQDRRERRYYGIFGLIEGTLTGILGVPGYITYGENLGFLTATKVAARRFIIYASLIIILLSFLGPIGGFMAAMPRPVAGAILLGIASTLVGEGAKIWQQERFESREVFIVSFSVFLSLGAYFLPDSFYSGVPDIIGTIMTNPIIFVMLIVILLEQVLFPREPLLDRIRSWADARSGQDSALED